MTGLRQRRCSKKQLRTLYVVTWFLATIVFQLEFSPRGMNLSQHCDTDTDSISRFFQRWYLGGFVCVTPFVLLPCKWHKLRGWMQFSLISVKSSSTKAQCTLAEANGDLPVRDPIDAPDTNCRLECSDFFLFIYLILPAAANASLSACDWKARREGGWASSRSHGVRRRTSQNSLHRTRERSARGGAVQSLRLHPGGEVNWLVVHFKSCLLVI